MKPITSLQPDHELSVEPVPAIVSCDIGFDELFATQRDATTRLAYLLTGSASHADEAVQESFARVYERWNAIDSPPAFLRTCVVNRCRSWHRHRAVAERKVHLLTNDDDYLDRPDGLADALATLPHRRSRTALLRTVDHRRDRHDPRNLGGSGEVVAESRTRSTERHDLMNDLEDRLGIELAGLADRGTPSQLTTASVLGRVRKRRRRRTVARGVAACAVVVVVVAGLVRSLAETPTARRSNNRTFRWVQRPHRP